MDEAALKTCRQCKATKPLEQFPTYHRQGQTKHSSPCRDCKRKSGREQSYAHRRVLGITPRAICRPHFVESLGGEGKRCSKCEEIKPLTEFIKRRDKLTPRCRACIRVARKEAYEANPQHFREMTLRHMRANKEQVAERQRAWRAREAEQVRERKRQRYERERAKNLEYANRRYANMSLEERRTARAKNRPNAANCEARRRAQKLTTQIEKVKRQDIIERDGPACYLCSKMLDPHVKGSLTLDHVIPLSRGGAHTADNLRICCRRCNSRKNARLLTELD